MKNILVFPCGSEIGLEIYRSLEFSTHFKLIGGNSINDHGMFVYDNYINDIPFVDSKDFIPRLSNLVHEFQIDAIFPAMDSVIEVLKKNENLIGCKVIASSYETTRICLSKSKTYDILKDHIAVPKTYLSIDNIPSFPVFLKPDIGYGSRGAKKVDSIESAMNHFDNYKNLMILEYLPGKEFTVDCFTDRFKKLKFVGARERKRVLNGISVNAIEVESNHKFDILAEKINKVLDLRGAWFFQVKENQKGDLVLLEVASRLAGSSSLYRNKGVNFAQLSLYDAFEIDIEILVNNFTIELDRALNNRYRVGISYKTVYVDFDDCIVINDYVNFKLVGFLYKCINEAKKVILITKHAKNINDTLSFYRLNFLFDQIIHLSKSDKKWLFMEKNESIFIDDSFQERKEVFLNLNIPVFSPDAIEALL